MKRYILTGTPGAGKTAILRMLEWRGHAVVEEAATDVMAIKTALGVSDPSASPSFIDDIVMLQMRRHAQARNSAGPQFHDRSVVCSLALARYLGHPVSDLLARELNRVKKLKPFSNSVFFIRNVGFCAPTEARRISFEDSLRFERIHEEVYRSLDFDLVMIPAAPLADRVDWIEAAVRARADNRG
jgi:predicted ATPase